MKVELSFNMVPREIAKAPLSYLHVVPHLYVFLEEETTSNAHKGIIRGQGLKKFQS